MIFVLHVHHFQYVQVAWRNISFSTEYARQPALQGQLGLLIYVNAFHVNIHVHNAHSHHQTVQNANKYH
jgi:hypothetical protein